MNLSNDLFAEFAPTSTQQWQNSVAKFLKGKSLDTLTWTTEDLHVAALYRKENTTPTFSTTYASPKHWNMAEWIPTQDAKLANQLALEALAGGANELVLQLTDTLAHHFEDIIKGIHLSMIRLSFAGDLEPSLLEKITQQLATYARQEPLQGTWSLKNDFSNIFNGLLKQSQASFVYHTFSESDSLETTTSSRLAQLLHQCFQQLAKMLEAGSSLENAIAQLSIVFSVGNSYFVEIAKLRAFRKLWLAMLEGMGATQAQFPHIQAITQSVFKDDMYYNMIVCTSQAMSAAIGQVDTLMITPSTGWEKSTLLARRIARNIHHLLQYESHLEQVVDAAAGSYYLENLTQQLTEQTWFQFLQLTNNQ